MPLRLPCDVCHKVFTKREHYARHMRVHTRERPFSCHHCGLQFARLDTLNRHKRSLHPESVEPDDTDLIGSAMDPMPEAAVDDPSAAPGYIDPTLTPRTQPAVPPSDSYPQWENTYQLGPDFSLESLGIYDIMNGSPGIPLISMHQDDDVSQPSQSARTTARIKSRYVVPWFTRTPHAQSRLRSYKSNSADLSRDTLTISLQHKTSAALLPPNSFLNRAIHTYTTKLWSLMPVVHLPTFVPARAHPLLLLSICSLGALAEGTPESLEHAVWLFEGVQKAILVNWDPDHVFDPAVVALLQAATIGQTFAILSPKPSHLVTARAFHGTLCVALDGFRTMMQSLQHTTGDTLQEQWEQWIQLQSCIRLINALQCHDGELSATFQRRPMLRWPAVETISASNDNAFLATTAEDWFEKRSQSDHTIFSSCAFLESLLAEIIDARAARFEIMQPELNRLGNVLMDWNDEFAVLALSETSRLSLSFLMHSCFIQLHCDLDKVEQFLGRDGDEQVCSEYAVGWSSTTPAKKCLVHAITTARLAAQLRLSDVAAMHVARAMFSAAMILVVFATCAPQDTVMDNTAYAARFSSTATSEEHTDMFGTSQTSLVDHCKMLAFSVAGTLGSLRPWPNAERYAKTLAAICTKLDT